MDRGGSRIPRPVAARLAQRAFGSELTPRESDVLQLMVQARSNREIAEALSLSEQTVKRLVSTILDKLGAADRTQALTTALRRGLAQLEYSTPISSAAAPGRGARFTIRF